MAIIYEHYFIVLLWLQEKEELKQLCESGRHL